MVKMRRELPVYIMFGTNAIEETAYVYELRYHDVLLFFWVHYIQWYFIKTPTYNLSKIVEILDHVKYELPHSKAVLNRLFNLMLERGIVDKVGDRFVRKDPNALVETVSNRLTAKMRAFEEATLVKNGMPRFKPAKKRYNKRRRGRPTGWRKKKKDKIVFSCKTKFVSKTDKLFK